MSSNHFGGSGPIELLPSSGGRTAYDFLAVEYALRLREIHGGEVTVFCMGTNTIVDPIWRGLAMGADRGVFLSDPALARLDAFAIGRAIACVLAKAGFDMVLFGRESADGHVDVIPSIVSKTLDIPFLAQVVQLEVANGRVIAQCNYEDGKQTVEVTLPASVSLALDPRQEVRPTSLRSIMLAKRKPLGIWTLADLDMNVVAV